MYGILKVIHGTLTVACYNKIPHVDLTKHQPIPEALRNHPSLIERGHVVPVLPIAPKSSMNASSSPLIVSPDKDNYHELYNGSDQPVAFVDILSPPYNHRGCELEPEGDSEVRECEYFKVVRLPSSDGGDKNITWLQRIKPPVDYHCDTEPYLGPNINI